MVKAFSDQRLQAATTAHYKLGHAQFHLHQLFATAGGGNVYFDNLLLRAEYKEDSDWNSSMICTTLIN